MRWRSFVYLALACGAVVGAYFVVWMPCLGSLLALAALTLGVAAVVSAARARRALGRANEPASAATAGLVTSVGVLPVVALAVIGCVTLNAAVTVVSAAPTLVPAGAAVLLDRRSPAHAAADEDRDRAEAVSFWNGHGYGDLVPTDIEPGEDEGNVRRTIRVGLPFALLAALFLVHLAADDETSESDGVTELPDTATPDAGA